MRAVDLADPGLDPDDAAVIGMRQSNRVADDGIEDGPDRERRAAHDAEDVGERGLSLERLLRLVEEAYVLDRDRCLVRERAHEILFSLRKGADFAPRE